MWKGVVSPFLTPDPIQLLVLLLFPVAVCMACLNPHRRPDECRERQGGTSISTSIVVIFIIAVFSRWLLLSAGLRSRAWATVAWVLTSTALVVSGSLTVAASGDIFAAPPYKLRTSVVLVGGDV